MCVQVSQKCPGLKKLLRGRVRRSTTPTRPMESHAAQSDVARRGIPYLYMYGVGSSAARVQSQKNRSARRNSRVHGRPRQSGGAKHACPGLFQGPRNSISRWTCRIHLGSPKKFLPLACWTAAAMPSWLTTSFIACAAAATAAALVLYLPPSASVVSVSGAGGSGASSWASNGISESSSGTLFRAVRTRHFTPPRLFTGWTRIPQQTRKTPNVFGRTCKNWAVTTTIFPPTTTVNQIAALPDWCLVVAGDRKTPKVYNVSGGAVYLSPADQEKMSFKSASLLRWNHFGRKNLGFLYAIQHGARWVYDTDDDNELQRPETDGIPLPRLNAMVGEVETTQPLYNLYPQLSTVSSSWPRGFPLEAIKDNRTTTAAIRRRVWSARKVRLSRHRTRDPPQMASNARPHDQLAANAKPASAGIGHKTPRLATPRMLPASSPRGPRVPLFAPLL
jgi:hypothetical protein